MASVEPVQPGHGGVIEEMLRRERDQDLIDKFRELICEESASGKNPKEIPGVKFDNMKIPPGHGRFVKTALGLVSEVFAKSDDDYGCLKEFEAQIDVKGATPVRQRPRRIPHALREHVRKEIERMVRIGQVRQCRGGLA
jgi:hypothetical protein